MKPYGYLYKTTIFTGRKVLVYVGKRVKPNFVKSYFGSGKIVTKILREGSYQSKKVELVEYFYSREELNEGEKALVVKTREEWLDHCINIAPGGESCGGGFNLYWTLDRCQKSALNFDTRSEWARGASGAYDAAQRNEWIDLCCSHMQLRQLPNGYWTLERCKEDALKYKTRSDWIKSPGGAYAAAAVNGWLDVCYEHMEQRKAPNGYWTNERLKADALKFNTRMEWQAKSSRAYTAANRRGILDYCCSHMEVLIRPDGYWTLDRCKEDALKYTSRSAWGKGSNPAAYGIARKSGWLELCCGHMRQLRKPNGYWTLERCKKDAKRFNSRKMWKLKSSAAFDRANSEGWLDICCSHMNVFSKPKNYWTIVECKKSASKFNSRNEWQKGEIASYAAAWRNGWIDECCAHMEATRKPDGYWTVEKCVADARRYLTKSEWRRNNSSAYSIAGRSGWLDECCAHMDNHVRRAA